MLDDNSRHHKRVDNRIGCNRYFAGCNDYDDGCVDDGCDGDDVDCGGDDHDGGGDDDDDLFQPQLPWESLKQHSITWQIMISLMHSF